VLGKEREEPVSGMPSDREQRSAHLFSNLKPV